MFSEIESPNKIAIKAQPVRILDVILIGPMMIWFASNNSKPGWAKSLMYFFGITTIIYNGRNYYMIEQRKKQLEL